MGFLDALFGKSKLPKAKSDKIFAMSTAYITLESHLNLKQNGSGICFKPLEASKFVNAESEIKELLYQSCKETNTQYDILKDSYNYLWGVFHDSDFEDLVTTSYLVAETLKEHGFEEQLLCAVFKFKDKSLDIYWIYNFKQGNYYPFVPIGKKRDTAYEFRMRSVMEKELPIEKNVDKWYPLWDIPV